MLMKKGRKLIIMAVCLMLAANTVLPVFATEADDLAVEETEDYDGVGVEVSDTKEVYTPVQQFVRRLYQIALNRDVDEVGFDDWTQQLVNKTNSGAGVGWGFIFSNEFIKRNLSDSEYLDVLYKTFMDREADETGKTYWMHMLANGVSREYVFTGFAHSQEYENICKEYDIERGIVTLTAPRDQNPGVTMFVFRCYDKSLNRKPDEEGLNDWTNRLLTKKEYAEEVAYGFIFSQEFVNKNYSDEEYVKILYRVFLDREYDENGLKDWVSQLQTKSRVSVFYGFSRSVEFENLCQSYGIEARPAEEKTAAQKTLDKYVDTVLTQIINDSMSEEEKLRACYDWIVDNCKYAGASSACPSGYTLEQYCAIKMYETRKGNCYYFSSMFIALAKGLGHTDAKMVEGTYLTSWGGWRQHAWADINGTIYDPQQDYVRDSFGLSYSCGLYRAN